jgi:ABC-2 type transport system permease protein
VGELSRELGNDVATATNYQGDLPLVSETGATFSRVLRAEWTKFWSVRSTLWTLLIAIALTVGLGVLFSWGLSTNLDDLSPEERAGLDPTGVSLGGLGFGQLAIAVLGVLIISSEYSTGGIKATFTAVPQRLKVLLAKALVLFVVALVIGTVTSFAAFFLGQLFWQRVDLATSLSDPDVLRAVLGGGLYVAGSGLFGYAFGVLLRHTAGAITAAVALLLVLPPLTLLLPGEWGETIEKNFTSNAGQTITTVTPAPNLLDPWVGYAVFTAQWLVFLIVGAVLMQRRDA